MIGICILPIVGSEESQEFELQLAENYLLSNRWEKNILKRNQEDFKYLTEQVKVARKIDEVVNGCMEKRSNFSFDE